MTKQNTHKNHLSAGLRVRSGLIAGEVYCYQEINGILYPMQENSPYIPPSYTQPVDPFAGQAVWTCNSCKGNKIAAGQLKNAQCSVCN